MMKLPTYAEFMKMGKEAVELAKAPLRIRQVKKQAELELLKLEEQLVSAEEKINSEAMKHPVAFSKLIDAIDEKELLERRISQFHELISQMFPEEK
jgi:hypothetical protein